MNTFIFIALSLVVISIIIATVFLVTTLVQIRRTAKEAEFFVHHLNEVGKIVDNVSSFTQNFGSPIAKIGAILSGLISTAFMKYKTSKNTK